MDTEIEKETPVNETTETNDEIDTSWIDSFGDKDIDNTETDITETNDKRDRDRDTETTVKEESYSPFDTSYFDNSYDTAPEPQAQTVESNSDDTPYVFSDAYVDEANKNMKKWQQMAEENARTGKELAYTNKEVEKQEADALNKALNKSNEAAGIFSDPLGALKNLGDTAAAIPRSVTSGFDGGAEIQKEFQGLNREQQIEKIARNLAENPDYDVEKVLNVLGNNKTLSQTVDAIKDLAKTYEFTNKKRADIAANGETSREGISAASEQQIINDAMKPARDALNKAYESGDPRAIANAEQQYKQVANRLSEQYANSPAAKSVLNEINSLEMEAPARTETPETRTPTPTRPTTPAPTPAPTATPTAEPTPETPTATETTAEEPVIDALTRDQADYQRMRNQGWDADRMIRDPNTGKLLREPEVDRDKYTPTSSTTTQEEGRDSNTIPHNEELNNFLPIEIINTNPENIEGVAEALDNGDTETAEYLLSNSLSTNNFLQILDKVSLGGQSISPELLAVIQSMWDKLLAGQSVGKVNASDLSNLGREKRDAINKALQNYSETDLKDLGYYSRDTSATNESDYNKGLVENTNEVVSDVVKKYIIANPWILQAVSKWSK